MTHLADVNITCVGKAITQEVYLFCLKLFTNYFVYVFMTSESGNFFQYEMIVGCSVVQSVELIEITIPPTICA